MEQDRTDKVDRLHIGHRSGLPLASDERGYLRCVERWGGDDGPDDAIENVNDWPHLHALGAPDVIRTLYRKAWEGHLRQYTQARTVEVPFARDGMYYKEFPVMFDWQ